MFQNMESINSFYSSCIIITGMHRSGTSLISSYLHTCGLDVGNDLLSPEKGNIKGYFEDRDFVNFHRRVINKNKNNMFLLEKIKFDSEDLDSAYNIIRKKNKSSVWGWKDPRTILFLDFWDVLLHKSFYIFLYRHPFQVINSLLKRGTDTIINYNPLVSAKSWINYNTKILQFNEKNHDRILLLNIDDIIKNNSDTFLELIKGKFNIKLYFKPLNSVFDVAIFNNTSKNFGIVTRLVTLVYRKKLMRLYAKLESQKTHLFLLS